MEKLLIRIRPLTLVIPEEREALYKRLKDALDRVEDIANDERVKPKLRLEALRLIGYLGQVMLGALKEAQLDEIDRRLRKLEEEARASREEI
ncbi:hypothetical protein J7L70_01455 [Candidatus Bathyarchaeota archaeon]|nr:hypothetical protein [Candidatus Bathyarchaeota archaeon]